MEKVADELTPGYPTTVPVQDGQFRASEIAEAIAFFLALLAYLWWLVIPLPWSGALVLLAVAVSWRRRSLTPKSLGLGWEEFRASGRRWGVVWIFSLTLFLILGHRRLFSLAALMHGAVYFAWAAAQQIVYQSMTYLPLRENLKSRGLAAGLAGVAFSIMHVPNPVLVPATYVWGVASSLLFERCRTVWGLALLQTMLSSTLFWITPPELNRSFRIGPYYYEVHSPQVPDGTFSPPFPRTRLADEFRERAGTARPAAQTGARSTIRLSSRGSPEPAPRTRRGSSVGVTAASPMALWQGGEARIRSGRIVGDPDLSGRIANFRVARDSGVNLYDPYVAVSRPGRPAPE